MPKGKNRLLLIETSTQACSVALSVDNVITASRYSDEPKAHARLLAPFIEDILHQSLLSFNDLSAVAVSEGPGSYTGLRVGVSTAKGICYGSSLPLIAVNTLDILADTAIKRLEKKENLFVVPMIDARRMEVYSAIYNEVGERLEEIRPITLEPDTFDNYYSKGELIFIGDGAEKYKSLLDPSRLNRSVFINTYPIAQEMLNRATQLLEQQSFQDVAYFEPFYLKEFMAGKSTKKLF